MRLSGHHHRLEDLSRIAALGIRTLRFPVLWERVAPDRPDRHDWRWSDTRLAECERLGVRPIIGLLHHGSGPRYTSLVDPAMPALFARHAAAVAERYPAAQDWTPVNEPVTTARFSALYGAWYPHARDTRTFWLALLGQIDATRLAMRAIRRVSSRARLIQTDDLGKTWSTPEMAPIADYYNARRWLGWDLLAGRVDEAHPMWEEANRLGLGDRLRAIRDDPCPPDVIGVNHYPTSDRFLDHRAHYGPLPDSGYHDMEALRVLVGAETGLAPLLRQAWDRYRLPLAVTECHLGCTREEQLRWLTQAWDVCGAQRADGVDVRALTIWALFGSVDWNSLLTVEAGHYEPGAFDIRGEGAPRPTALAHAAAALARGAANDDRPHHAMARMAGWWERPIRLEHPPVAVGKGAPAIARADASMRPILITGGAGRLGQAFAGACALRGLTHLVSDRATLPINDERRVSELLDLYRPWAVVNAAGWSDVDAAEADEMRARDAATGAGVVARGCAARGIACLVISSDLVFDGGKAAPYTEADAPRPLGAYGRSLLLAERLALAADALVVRTGPCFSPHDDRNAAMRIERALAAGRSIAASERTVTPTYLPDLVHVCLDLLIDGERGLWHLTNGEPVTELDFARRLAAAMALDPRLVVAGDGDTAARRAPRPAMSALASTRGAMLPSLDDALARHAVVRLPLADRLQQASGAPDQAAPRVSTAATSAIRSTAA